MTQLALVIDLNVCVGCHACVTSCKEWNTSGTAGYMADMNPYGKDPTGPFSTVYRPLKWVSSRIPKPYTFQRAVCIVKIRPVFPCVRPAPVTNVNRMVSCWLTVISVLAATTVHGLAHTALVNWTSTRKS